MRSAFQLDPTAPDPLGRLCASRVPAPADDAPADDALADDALADGGLPGEARGDETGAEPLFEEDVPVEPLPDGTPFTRRLEILVEEGRRRGFVDSATLEAIMGTSAESPEGVDGLFDALEPAGLELRPRRRNSRDEDDELARVQPGPLEAYLADLRRIPLLSRTEELLLAKTVRLARERVRELLFGSRLGRQEALERCRTAIETGHFHRLIDAGSLDLGDAQPLERLRAAVEIPGRRWRARARALGALPLRNEVIDDLTGRLRSLRHRALALIQRRGRLQRRAADSAELDEPIHEELRAIEKHVGETLPSLDERLRRIDATLRRGNRARKLLADGNLRLVVSVAKRHRSVGVSFMDLIQEGNAGLLRAVDKYDYRLGYRFSTYATWWIRQSVARAHTDQTHLIRLPMHLVETISRVRRVTHKLRQTLGSEPDRSAIASEAGLSEDDVEKVLDVVGTTSLDQPFGDETEATLGHVVGFEDDSTDETDRRLTLKDRMKQVLQSLPYRERQILELRYGLGGVEPHTLEEIGRMFRVTRERIRQVERRALKRLRMPLRSRYISGFFD